MLHTPAAHKAAQLIPAMSDEEYQSLKADINVNGQIEPIVLYEGKILDGRHRWQACQELEIKPRTKEWSGDGSPVAYVISQNLHRRHLTMSQQGAVALEANAMREAEERGKRRKSDGGKASGATRRGENEDVARLPQLQPAPKARDEVAAMFNVGARYIQDAKAIRKASPELFEQVKTGEKTIPQALRVIKGKPERGEILPVLFALGIGKALCTLSTIRDRYGDGETMLNSEEWKQYPRGSVDNFVLFVRDMTEGLNKLSKEIKGYKVRT